MTPTAKVLPRRFSYGCSYSILPAQEHVIRERRFRQDTSHVHFDWTTSRNVEMRRIRAPMKMKPFVRAEVAEVLDLNPGDFAVRDILVLSLKLNRFRFRGV